MLIPTARTTRSSTPTMILTTMSARTTAKMGKALGRYYQDSKSTISLPSIRFWRNWNWQLMNSLLKWISITGFSELGRYRAYPMEPRLVRTSIKSGFGRRIISLRTAEIPLWYIHVTQICHLRFCRLTLLDYRYSALSTKSPDASFVPRDITSPPALAQPEWNNAPYPTWVFEVAHSNEGWDRLKNDARMKAFSAQTSIQVFVGIKIYSQHFRVFWARRSPVGHGMRIQRTSPKLRINQPTGITFNIPATLIYWGCPNVPPLPSPNIPLRLDVLRRRIMNYVWGIRWCRWMRECIIWRLRKFCAFSGASDCWHSGLALAFSFHHPSFHFLSFHFVNVTIAIFCMCYS